MVSTFISRISAGHIVSCLLSENRLSLVIDSGWLIVGFFGSGHDYCLVLLPFFASSPTVTWPWLLVIIGYFSGIIHVINVVISTYN